MADLRARFLEDYAGGFLNVSRQELSSTGEVLSQDGFNNEQTIFVEDGVGVKSGLKLGVGLAEAVDPTTQLGLVNVRYADRTYTKIRDTKVFLTAIASAQAALSDAVVGSISNIEQAIQNIDITSVNLDRKISSINEDYAAYKITSDTKSSDLTNKIISIEDNLKSLNLSLEKENINIGEGSLLEITRGSLNLAVGYNALGNITIGSENIGIGNFSKELTGALERGNNNILIGNNCLTTEVITNNEIIIGNNYNDFLRVPVDPYTPQSISVVSNLETQKCISLIKNITPKIIINSMSQEDYSFDSTDLKNKQSQYGFRGIVHKNNDISKGKLIPILVEVIKNLITRIEVLEG